MGRVLLVEGVFDAGRWLASTLAREGHLVTRCGGGSGIHHPCPLLRVGDCPLPSGTDAIVIWNSPFGRLAGRSYDCVDLVSATAATLSTEESRWSLLGLTPLFTKGGRVSTT